MRSFWGMSTEISHLTRNFFWSSVTIMEKHIRFHIDLAPDDAKLLDKLAVHLSNKKEATVIRADAIRIAIRQMAKQEKIA
jgi:hypothetical protein